MSWWNYSLTAQALARSVVFVFRADCSPLSTGILYSRLQRVTIPEAVII